MTTKPQLAVRPGVAVATDLSAAAQRRWIPQPNRALPISPTGPPSAHRSVPTSAAAGVRERPAGIGRTPVPTCGYILGMPCTQCARSAHAVRTQCEVLDVGKYSNPSFGPFSQVFGSVPGFFWLPKHLGCGIFELSTISP